MKTMFGLVDKIGASAAFNSVTGDRRRPAAMTSARFMRNELMR